jgi:hypothetical protein
MKFHKNELHNLFSLDNIIREINLRRIEWTGNLACKEYVTSFYTVLVGSFNGKTLLGTRRRSRKDNIQYIRSYPP